MNRNSNSQNCLKCRIWYIYPVTKGRDYRGNCSRYGSPFHVNILQTAQRVNRGGRCSAGWMSCILCHSSRSL